MFREDETVTFRPAELHSAALQGETEHFEYCRPFDMVNVSCSDLGGLLACSH